MSRALLLLLLALPLPVLADAPPPSLAFDGPADAPSLALETDPGRPIYRFAAYIDPVALFLDGYGLSVLTGLGRFASITLSPFGAKSDGGTLGLELGLHVRPFGRGVQGLTVGAGGGARLSRQDDDRGFRLFAEAGYMHVLGGLLVGGSLGLDVRVGEDERFAPRVRVVLGYAFR